MKLPVFKVQYLPQLSGSLATGGTSPAKALPEASCVWDSILGHGQLIPWMADRPMQ